jgi:hypothetical protein
MVTIEPGVKFWDWIFGYPLSVNFSSDFDSIFLYASGGIVYQFKLNENKLDPIGTTSGHGWGYVNRDGTVHPPSLDSYICNIVSAEGYYQYIDVEPDIDLVPDVLLSTSSDNPFTRWTVDDQIFARSPFGEELNITGKALSHWGHIQAPGVLIQSFMWNSPNEKRMYKSGASCLDTVIGAVGAAEANLFGLAYIPSTNRLN